MEPRIRDLNFEEIHYICSNCYGEYSLGKVWKHSGWPSHYADSKTSVIFTTLQHIGQFQLTFNVWELIQLGKKPVYSKHSFLIYRAFVKCHPYTHTYKTFMKDYCTFEKYYTYFICLTICILNGHWTCTNALIFQNIYLFKNKMYLLCI